MPSLTFLDKINILISRLGYAYIFAFRNNEAAFLAGGLGDYDFVYTVEDASKINRSFSP